jgi:hypothetical protein
MRGIGRTMRPALAIVACPVTALSLRDDSAFGVTFRDTFSNTECRIRISDVDLSAEVTFNG